MKPAKAMTIRLSADQAEALETVASVEQRAVADIIRAAISEHIETRRHDPQFQKGLRARIDRAQRLLDQRDNEN
jgi:predicted transcriptional regulator